MEAQMETSSLTAAPTTTRLYEAVIKGDTASFHELVTQHPLIIDRYVLENASSCCFPSPLLLHVAADKGHLEMVKSLLKLRPSMCLAHDRDGRNPIHVAAIQSHVDVLKELHDANAYAAQERTNSGDTILHLCIKHKQSPALKTLLKDLKLTNDDGGQLLNSKDSNGNTVLHLAMTSNQPENNQAWKPTKQSMKSFGNAAIVQSLKLAKPKLAKEVQNDKLSRLFSNITPTSNDCCCPE